MCLNKKLLGVLALGLILMIGLSACSGGEDLKYAEEVMAIATELQTAMLDIDTIDESDPESLAAGLEKIDNVIESCKKLGELEAPSNFEKVQTLFKEGADSYIVFFEDTKLMLQNPDDLEIYEQAQAEALEQLMNGVMKFSEAQELLNEMQ